MDFINKKDFRKQIAEDIKEYQELYPTMKNLQKDEWAFNFWILDKIFKEDENVIEEKIIDYNDKGIDCYIWHEELKNLYIIQNKYYDDNSNVSVDYVFNDFLTRSIGALEKGTYSHSPELQKIYNKYHSDDDFQLFFHLYITNNNKDYKLLEKISSYNVNHKNKEAKVFYLDDIYAQYFNQPIVDTKELTVDIATINSGTYLNIDTNDFDLPVTYGAIAVKIKKNNESEKNTIGIGEWLNKSNGQFAFINESQKGESFIYQNGTMTDLLDWYKTERDDNLGGTFVIKAVTNKTELAVTLLGDIDLNNKIDIKDATDLQIAISGDSKLSAVQNLNADTDENGEINVNDVTQLQFMIANNN